MLTALTQAGTRALGGARFSLVNLLPTSFLIIFVALLITSGAYTQRQPDPAKVIDKLGTNPGWSIAAAFGIFLLAVLLRPFQTALVQILEGYWRRWRLIEFAAGVATERHRRIKNTAEVRQHQAWANPPNDSKFEVVADYARRTRRVDQIRRHALAVIGRYPLPEMRDLADGHRTIVDDRLMPTLLGNVLRDAEDNAGRRYGLRATVVYPRLYPTLSPKLDAAISQQLDLIDTTSALCIGFAAAALSSLSLLIRLDRWSIAPLITTTLALLAYRGAVRAARGYGRLLATAFDLHRFDMLTALHYELPRTPAVEANFNKTLSSFLDSKSSAADRLRGVHYAHPLSPPLVDKAPGSS